MAIENHWYRNGDQKVGPFSFTTLKEIREQNGVSDETLVSVDDGMTWIAYENISVSAEEIEVTEKVNETNPNENDEKILESENISPLLFAEKPISTLRAEQRSVKETDQTKTVEDVPKLPSSSPVKINKREPVLAENRIGVSDSEKSPKKISMARHLLYGFLIAFCISLVSNSITKGFHLITLNFLLNFETKLIYGYVLMLSGVLGGALGYFIIGCIALLFRSQTFFYILLLASGFFSISGSTLP